MKVLFRGYNRNKKGEFEGGYGDVLTFLQTLNDDEAFAKIDYDMPYEGEDIIADSLKIKNLKFNEKNDHEFEATFETTKKSSKYVAKLLIKMGMAGNGGHSYGVKINKKKIYIDGDGADYLTSINGIDLKHLKDPYHYGDVFKNETESNQQNESKQIIINGIYLSKIIIESIKRNLNIV